MLVSDHLRVIADATEDVTIDCFESAAQIRQVAEQLDWLNAKIKNFFTAEELEGMTVRQLRAKMLELQDASRGMLMAVDAHLEELSKRVPKDNIQQEFEKDTSRHRLVNKKTGKSTPWTAYTLYAYLDGYVGYTAYFGTKEGVSTPDEFIKMTTGEDETAPTKGDDNG